MQAKGIRIIIVIWWCIALFILSAVIEGVAIHVIAAWKHQQAYSWAIGLQMLRLIIVFFVLIMLFWGGTKIIPYFLQDFPKTREPTTPIDEEKGVAFPHHATLPIGLWLAVAAIVLMVCLIQAISPSPFINQLLPVFSTDLTDSTNTELRNLLVTIFAAGIGSLITTIMGYLQHVSRQSDFKQAYVPWYFARPVIGMLLGIVFYFVLKGGLLVTVGVASAKDINIYGLAGLSALVGLFSKNAVEKLRDVFGTLFTAEANIQEKLIDSLPKELADEVKKALLEKKSG